MNDSMNENEDEEEEEEEEEEEGKEKVNQLKNYKMLKKSTNIYNDRDCNNNNNNEGDGNGGGITGDSMVCAFDLFKVVKPIK